MRISYPYLALLFRFAFFLISFLFASFYFFTAFSPFKQVTTHKTQVPRTNANFTDEFIEIDAPFKQVVFVIIDGWNNINSDKIDRK